MLTDSDTDDSDDETNDWVVELPDGTEIDVETNPEDPDPGDTTPGSKPMVRSRTRTMGLYQTGQFTPRVWVFSSTPRRNGNSYARLYA